MSKNHYPLVMYKFRSGDKRSFDMLEKNQLYFANPNEFNDPFDCAAQEHIFEEFRAETLELLALHQSIPPDAITRDKTNQFIAALKEHPEIKQICAEQQNEYCKFIENIGILCFSGCNDSILMWSHYSNSHRGFCIGFKSCIFPDILKKKVKYSPFRTNDIASQLLLIQKMTDQEKEQHVIDELIFTKYFHWEYEDEWRAISDKGVKCYSDQDIDCIMLGAKMPEAQRNRIYSFVNGKNIRLYEAKKNRRNYSLDIQEIATPSQVYI